VVPSLKVKSLNSSSPFLPPAPLLKFTTPLSSTLTFLPSAAASLEISGRVSALETLASDFYKNYYYINKIYT
jgi:hypothetical protein